MGYRGSHLSGCLFLCLNLGGGEGVNETDRKTKTVH